MKNSLWLLLLLSVSIAAAPLSVSRKDREIELAERVLLLSRMQFASPSMRIFCRQWGAVCVVSESVELALNYIGRSDAENSTPVLIGLVRFRLDAGLGEDYTCHVLARRNDALHALEKIDADRLRDRCLREFSEMRSMSDMTFSDSESDYVCSTVQSIRARLDDFISAINARRLCDAGDF